MYNFYSLHLFIAPWPFIFLIDLLYCLFLLQRPHIFMSLINDRPFFYWLADFGNYILSCLTRSNQSVIWLYTFLSNFSKHVISIMLNQLYTILTSTPILFFFSSSSTYSHYNLRYRCLRKKKPKPKNSYLKKVFIKKYYY
jgi:hypothetical protein